MRFPLSLRNVEDLLHERGIEVSHETIRFWWNRFRPIFAAELRKKRKGRMRALLGCRWHLDEVFVKINGERHYLWRAVDQEGEVLETGADVSDFVGSVRCTVPAEGEGMFTGVAVEIDVGNQIFTTLPVVPVPERMSQE